jgi:hypothetical protein
LDRAGNQLTILGISLSLGNRANTSEINWSVSTTNNLASVNFSTAGVYMGIATTAEKKNESVSLTKYLDDPTEASVPLSKIVSYFDIHSTLEDDEISSVYLQIFYTSQELTNAGISNEEKLVLYYFNNNTQVWQQLSKSDALVNDLGVEISDQGSYAGYYWANLTHLSSFGLGEEDDQSPYITFIKVHPDPVTRGENITINVTLSDFSTGNNLISSAEYYVDEDSCAPTVGTCPRMVNLTPLDSATEKFNVSYDTSSLEIGMHTVYVRGNDSLGNWRNQPRCLKFNVSENVTAVTISEILNSSPTIFVNSSDQFLNVTTDRPAHCKYSQEDRNFSLMTSFTSTDATSHSVNVSSLINEGPNIFYVRCANDSSGKSPMFYSLTIHFILDTHWPRLLSLFPQTSNYSNNKKISFSLGDSTSRVNLSSITVKWNGTTSGNFSVTNCSENAHGGYNCSYLENNITVGRNNLTLDARDIAGNSLLTVESIFTYDNVSPALSNPLPTTTQDYRTLEVSVQTDENSTCRYAFNNVSWSQMGYYLTETSANVHRGKTSLETNGDYQVYFRCRDLAGNEGYGNTPSFSVYEREAPSLTIGGIEEDYRPGEIITVYASLTNFTGIPINASTFCNLTITHWNGSELVTDLNNTALNFTGQLGWYYYLWVIPGSADKGSYGVLVKADPNGAETQATSGFHVAEWAEEIGHLWERFERANQSVLHNESIVSSLLSFSSDIIIYYNLTVPLKEGYTSEDYLPVRWKFWFLDEDGKCVSQVRGSSQVAEPSCNPLVAQWVARGNSTSELNVTLRPSLGIGNYTLVREFEVDPARVWISYGREKLTKISIISSTRENSPSSSVSLISALFPLYKKSSSIIIGAGGGGKATFPPLKLVVLVVLLFTLISLVLKSNFPKKEDKKQKKWYGQV